ncbi:GNAT family N-acetyltransferase [Derxia gummosa]|uniref:GNAT family N-acetyltransferase n=1 Tax=Derxia gummosa DSM 723 TaxID=1121388 RepID=A0A8B6X5S5_9BURK|nr:GNAT family N-acetyltransferase [Derxia gummosa]
MTTPHLARLPDADLAWANARYAEVDFLPSDASHFLALAMLDGERAGLGRVVPVSATAGELGGMVVLPAFRGRGVADALVGFLVAQSRFAELFCIPFADLVPLYARHGFVTLPDDAPAPAPVADKLAWCRAHYPRAVALMRRAG